ncbi:MAG: pilus assembly protein N-terminal domain-containing protein [Myxococcales bacterium]|nr:pilus assembly protein N-terminal domain-containing protein [Myxococcales bacterium]MDP3503533.1 pilus assembly protein N-terminal domain-containing protein [Myxococcales bacterium]
MRLLLAVLFTLALPAVAWPVDWVHDVEAGKERFVKLPHIDWWEIEDPKVLQVEWLADSNELLLSGLKPGRTVVLLGSEGRVAAWRVRVGGKPLQDEKLNAAALKACPDLKWTPLEDVRLTVTAHTEPCRQALLALFQTDAVEARALEVTMSGEVLQAQLKELQRAFETSAKGKVKARYVGAGLVLTGAVTQAEYRKVLWDVLRRSLGRFALDDQLEVQSPPAAVDAGAKP